VGDLSEPSHKSVTDVWKRLKVIGGRQQITCMVFPLGISLKSVRNWGCHVSGAISGDLSQQEALQSPTTRAGNCRRHNHPGAWLIRCDPPCRQKGNIWV